MIGRELSLTLVLALTAVAPALAQVAGTRCAAQDAVGFIGISGVDCNCTIGSRDPDALRAAHAALVRVTGGPAASAGSWLARARTALALCEVADALAAVDAALAIGGPLRPDALHMRARALLHTEGRAQEGARAYFEAARAMTPATSAALLDEILELTDPSERARFEMLSTAGRVAFLERFWDVRAGLAGETVGERLAAHQRRLALAHARYRRQAKWGAVPLNALLRDRPDGRFDDRGLLLVRHGEPLDIVRTVDRDLGGNESWLYTRPDGEPFMAHFVEYGDFSDYVLIYNVPCAPAWIADRLGHDARMNVLRNRCSTFDQRSVSYEIRRDVYAALASDSDPPAFTADLPFAFDLHTFRGAGGTTELLLSAAVPAAALRETADAAGRRMRAVTLALAVVDTQTSTVTRGDAIARALADTVHAHVIVSPPAARDAAIRVLARDGGEPRAGRLRGRGFTIPAYTGDTLMISDVLLAAPASTGRDTSGWERGGARLALAPGAAFDAAGFRVFAEIYNLPMGESYVTEVRVEREGGGVTGAIRRLFGGGSAVRLRFEEAASPDADGVVRVLRDVRSDLAAGDYVLTLRIVPANGSAVERQARLRIGGG